MRPKNSGFTLIELMIVVAVIGILAAMSLPSYQDRVIRTQVQETVAFVAFARDAVQTFHTKTHRLPLDNAEAGLPAAKQIIGNFISEVEVDHGAIHVRFGNRSNQVIAGKWLSLSRHGRRRSTGADIVAMRHRSSGRRTDLRWRGSHRSRAGNPADRVPAVRTPARRREE